MDNTEITDILKGYRPDFIYINFRDYIEQLNLTPENVSELTKKSPRTVRDWLAKDAPRLIYLYLYCCSGYLMHKDFRGFKVHRGKLYTNTNIHRQRGFAPGVLNNYAFFHQFMHTLQKENEDLKQALAEFESLDYKKRTIPHV